MREFRRAAVAVHVLHHADERDVHGAWLSVELAHHGYRISPGTLYPMLHRMEDEGLIASSEKIVDGRVLRRYRTTTSGRRELKALRDVIAELAAEVGTPGHAR